MTINILLKKGILMGFFNRKKNVEPSHVAKNAPDKIQQTSEPDLKQLKAPKGDILFDIQDRKLNLQERGGGWLLVYDRSASIYCAQAKRRITDHTVSAEDLVFLALAISGLTEAARMRICLYMPEKNRTSYLKYSKPSPAAGVPAFLLPAPDMEHPESECRCLYTSEGGLLSVSFAGRYLTPKAGVFITPEAIEDDNQLNAGNRFLSDEKHVYAYYAIFDAVSKKLFPLKLTDERISLKEMADQIPLSALTASDTPYLCLIGSEPEAICSFLKIGTPAEAEEGTVYTPMPFDSLYDSLISKPMIMEDGCYVALSQAPDGRICIRSFPAEDLDKYQDIVSAQNISSQIESSVFERFDGEITDVDAPYFFRYADDAARALTEDSMSDSLYYQMQKRIISNLVGMIDKASDTRSRFATYTEAYDQGWRSLQSLLNMIGDDIIMQAVTTRYMKMFLLSCKYDQVPQQDEYLNNILLRYNGTELFTIGSLFLRVDIAEVKDGHLAIEGYLRIPGVLSSEGLELTAYVNEKRYPVSSAPRYTDRYVFDKMLMQDLGFILRVPLTGSAFDIEFGIRNKGFVSLCRKIEFTAISPVTNNLKQAYCYQNGYVLQATANMITCRLVTTPDELNAYEDQFRGEIASACGSRADQIIRLRQYYLDNLKAVHDKERWLMIDRADRADDNAEVFFRHVVDKEVGRVDPVFILGKDAPQFEELSALGTVLDFHSEEHLKAFLTSDYIFSSQMAPSTTNPFNEDFDYFRDIIRRKRFVFLQHGLTHNDNGNAFSRYARNFYGIVVSANEEYEYMLSPEFHNPKDSIWLTGMPRFDLLHDDNRRMVTIMPTWRKNLTERVFDEEKGTNVWAVSNAFEESEYFNFYNSLINDPRVIKAAREHNYKIFFMPHVQFFSKAGTFDISDPEIISICDYDIRYRDVFAMSSLLMTDYSSVVFDFAYLQKPVLYCQFDKEAFFKEHTVKPGYFNFEDHGFGEVTYNYEDTVRELVSYIENDCQMKNKYRQRVDGFFRYHDHSCCERICQTVFSLEKTNN